jgi:hypothetical protein
VVRNNFILLRNRLYICAGTPRGRKEARGESVPDCVSPNRERLRGRFPPTGSPAMHTSSDLPASAQPLCWIVRIATQDCQHDRQSCSVLIILEDHLWSAALVLAAIVGRELDAVNVAADYLTKCLNMTILLKLRFDLRLLRTDATMSEAQRPGLSKPAP